MPAKLNATEKFNQPLTWAGKATLQVEVLLGSSGLLEQREAGGITCLNELHQCRVVDGWGNWHLLVLGTMEQTQQRLVLPPCHRIHRGSLRAPAKNSLCLLPFSGLHSFLLPVITSHGLDLMRPEFTG